MVDLQQAKEYLRVTYSDDDNYITGLIDVANGYMQDAITDYDNKRKHRGFCTKADMVILTLVQALYDERYMMGQKLEVSYIVQSMINQMEYGDYYVQSRTE